MEASDVHAILEERGITAQMLRLEFGVGPDTFAEGYIRGWFSLADLDALLADMAQAATAEPEAPQAKKPKAKRPAPKKESEDVEWPSRSDVQACAWPRKRARARHHHAYAAFSETAKIYGTRLG